MAEKISAEIIGFVTFMAMAALFVIWLTGQLQEFASFFGLRLSDVVAGDMSGLTLSGGGVPGDVKLIYTLAKSPGASATKASYNFRFGDNMICAQSVYSVEINTTDCYGVPSMNYQEKLSRSGSNENDIKFGIEKTAAYYDANGNYAKASTDMVCKAGCS